MQVLLFVLGLVLFLLGLLTGLLNPAVKNPRMGVASHLQGITNGPLLIVIGLLWPYVHLGHVWQIVTVALLTYGTYANWLATQLAAIWGAGRRFAPAAAGEHTASPAKEGVVDFLLASLAPAIIAATVILIVGVLR
ncbi:hydrogenase [Mycolicibacterium insubricum]|uniref:Hydrogenase n=1 Tax=Mycolicibacterium insubricum TaxID=444597 RepID=A0A1X0D9A2_9MYCO|nr:hydrogenase [Mycolicibacterium insubricum]MCB9442069.1 hydrogenase [Mycolicibacterium sp.]MCV7082500.1 hydrogenase [Mycolicibacterium insubricum]ORA68963.1 hydrogenase [Mycolicibacterium insubricum]BBZ68402.1 hydrogenase [Mycolicibacterium insubricum]